MGVVEDEVAFGLSTWGSTSFLKSPEQKGGVAQRGAPADADSTPNSLVRQVLLALPAAGVPEPFPCSGRRHAWLWPL